jgi:hypothetical protein
MVCYRFSRFDKCSYRLTLSTKIVVFFELFVIDLIMQLLIALDDNLVIYIDYKFPLPLFIHLRVVRSFSGAINVKQKNMF